MEKVSRILRCCTILQKAALLRFCAKIQGNMLHLLNVAQLFMKTNSGIALMPCEIDLFDQLIVPFSTLIVMDDDPIQKVCRYLRRKSWELSKIGKSKSNFHDQVKRK